MSILVEAHKFEISEPEEGKDVWTDFLKLLFPLYLLSIPSVLLSLVISDSLLRFIVGKSLSRSLEPISTVSSIVMFTCHGSGTIKKYKICCFIYDIVIRSLGYLHRVRYQQSLYNRSTRIYHDVSHLRNPVSSIFFSLSFPVPCRFHPVKTSWRTCSPLFRTPSQESTR